MTRKLVRGNDEQSKSFRELRMRAHIRKCCEYALKELPKILEYLNIKEWCLGGSVAGYLYGCDFGRIPSDIDVIIPEGCITKGFIDFINDSPLVKVITTGVYMDEDDNRNITIITVGSYPIDLVENKIGDQLTAIPFNDKVKISSPKSLLESKLKYTREKDKLDLIELQKLVDRLK